MVLASTNTFSKGTQFIWKLAIVVVAGLIGALLFDGLIVLSNILYDMRHHSGPWAQGVEQCLFVFHLAISSFTGHVENGYLLYAFLGAVPFAAMAAFWQFVWKPLRQLHDRNYAAYRQKTESASNSDSPER